MSAPDLTIYTFVEKLFTLLDLILHNYVYNGYTALSHYLADPLGLAIVLYIAIVGYGISLGWVKMNMGTLVKIGLKLGFLYAFAMNWGWLSFYAVKGIEGSAGQIGDILVSATPIQLPHFMGTGINGAMQSVLIEVAKVGVWVWDRGSWHNPGPLFEALVIWGFGYALLAFALFEIVMAKIMLAILFVTAPLFVSFTLFKTTHAFFDRWLGAVAGFSFLLIFVSAALALALSIFQWSIGAMYLDKALHISLVGFIPIVILGFIGIGLIKKVADYAQSFGGHISTGSASVLLAGTVGGFIGSSMTMLSQGQRLTGLGTHAVQGLTRALQMGNKAGASLGRGATAAYQGIKQRLRSGG